MLNFFRKNAQYIGWAIVIFFGGTMISGAFFYRNASKAQNSQNAKQEMVSRRSDFALIGQIPVNQKKYIEFLQQSLYKFQQSQNIQNLDPELLELIQNAAFNRAIQYTIFSEAARTQKLKVNKVDLMRALEQIYRQYDLKNKKALKKFLAERKYPYRLFIHEIEQDHF